DAAVERAEVLRAVELAALEAAALRAGAARLRFGRQRRDLAVLRIDDEPRLCALREVQVLDPPLVGAARAGGQLRDHSLRGFLANVRENVRRDVGERFAFELRGALERRG